jgi:hypothetical protein
MSQLDASFPLAGVAAALVVALLACGCSSNGSLHASAAEGNPGRDFSGVWWVEQPGRNLTPIDGTPVPLTPEGRREYEHYQADLKTGKIEDPTRKYCLPDGLPRLLTTPYPFEVVLTPDQATFLHEAHHVYRAIPLNIQHPPSQTMLDNYMGNAVAHWDADTLVIDSIRFNDETKLDVSGLPHSDQLHVTERWRKIDGGRRLQDEITIDDPATFTMSWTARITFVYRPDVAIQEYVCGEPHRNQSSPKGPSGGSINVAAGLGAGTAAAEATHSAFDGTWRNAGIGRRPPGSPGLCCSEEGWQDFGSKLQPWAMQELVRRDAALQIGQQLPTNSASCKPDGTPTVIDIPYSFEFVRTPSLTYILYEADNQSRRIRMNSVHPAKLNPTWYGDSIGHWDGDTLVVDTIGLNAQGQINWDGIPHTTALHVVERYTITKPGALELQMTLTDPGTLTGPWTVTKHFLRQKETQLYEYVCAQNNRDLSIPTE